MLLALLLILMIPGLLTLLPPLDAEPIDADRR